MSLDDEQVIGGGPQVVILSAFQDYRTKKQASIQQLADGLVRRGYEVSFISTRFSALSKRTNDSRLFLWKRSNRVETVNRVRCLLWRTSVHPFRANNAIVNAVMGKLYGLYAELPNSDFDRLVAEADYIVVESGVAAIYLRRLRRLNPSAKIIYYVTDRLQTVGVHPAVRSGLVRDHELVSHFSLRSGAFADSLSFAEGRLFPIGFGIDKRAYANVGPSPYPVGQKTVVSVGSMLFDPTFFQLAAPHFPDLKFHIIGCGQSFDAPANVHIHSEMQFAATLPYVKHATIGVAPYEATLGADYLADTSLKLAQFEHFGLPAICPHFAVGSASNRIGYEPGNEQSIRNAIAEALSRAGHVEPREFPDWSEIATDVLRPDGGARPVLGWQARTAKGRPASSDHLDARGALS